MGFRAFLVLVALTMVHGCVLEDTPVNGGTGAVGGGSGGTGGSSGAGGTAGGAGGAGGTGGICGGCTAPTPLCNEDTAECVECTVTDASFCAPTTPVCDGESFTCVECDENDDSVCLGPTPVCDTETLTCVGCLENTDCPRADAARCDLTTLTCEGCETDADCAQIDGLPRCVQGTCSQCRPATEAQDCQVLDQATSCNPATFTCTNTPLASRETCDTCVSDSDCAEPNERCIAMDYQGARFPNGQTGFCMKTTAGGCEQPYSITLAARQSLSGPPRQDYCGINEGLATCFAVRALLENERCPSGENAECPQPSGLCRQVGNLQNRCTYGCELAVQCPEAEPANTCGAPVSTEPDYCGG